MDRYTRFEDLSTEIFFEICDYLHAFDIFISFTSLNKNFFSLLKSIPLRVFIPYTYSRHQIDFLSSHLIHHSDQVISLDIYDKIRDDRSITSLLFTRHKFLNLQSCTINLIHSSPTLKNFIKQIKCLNTLVLIDIHQPNVNVFTKNDKRHITDTMLMHKSTVLRSLALHYGYDYETISKYRSIPSNLVSLKLHISNPIHNVIVRTTLSILRLCQRIQHLTVLIDTQLYDINNVNVSNEALSMDDYSSFLILTEIKFFNLIIFGRCDIRLIGYMLRCMPKLIRFIFACCRQERLWSYPGELLDGHVWEQMFELYVPCLSAFEFHMSIIKRYPKLDLDLIVKSFECLVQKYSNWHMVIDQWSSFNSQRQREYIMLRTLNFHKHELYIITTPCFIHDKTFATRSTTSINDHYRFYSNQKTLRLFLTERGSNITWSSPLFQHIKYLIVNIHAISSSSFLNKLINMVSFRQTDDNNDAKQYMTQLSDFVYLPNIKEVDFQSTFSKDQWKYIQFILQACSSVKNLVIDSRLLVASKIIDNPKLLSIFQQIKVIESIKEKIYFPSNFGLKLVERFPSLTEIELQVYSFDHCVALIEIFLDHLKNLSYIKMNYAHDTLLDDPFTCDYIIAKRREKFPDQILNRQLINVKNNGETIEIWLR